MKALQWFRWTDKTGSIDEWNDFTRALHIQFGPSGYDDPTGLLAELRQNLTNRTERLNDSFMVSCFITGLKEEIRLWV